MKKTLIIALLAAFAGGQAYAANADCAKKAEEKKLAGAAKTSFVKKCEKDAGGTAATAAASPACEKSAVDKKLHGAAKNSHIKKCTADEKAGTAKK